MRDCWELIRRFVTMVERPAKLSGGAPRLLFERVVVAGAAKEVVVAFFGAH